MWSRSDHPVRWDAAGSRGAGPSRERHDPVARRPRPSRRTSPERQSKARLVSSALLALIVVLSALLPSAVASASRQRTGQYGTKRRLDDTYGTRVLGSRELPTRSSPPSLSDLVLRRQDLIERDPQASQTVFNVDVSESLSTCEDLNITFSTVGGKPPFTVFIAFSDWASDIITIPASYADNDLTTWFYQYPLPYFTYSPEAPNAKTPWVSVTVGDSTGALLNSSDFRQVKSDRSDCAHATESLDFTFSTLNTSSCSTIVSEWYPKDWSVENPTTVPSWVNPLTMFVLASQQPPLSVPVTNTSATMLNFTLYLDPGTYFMFTMTDANGTGGVSGRNLAGIDEYVGLGCLQDPSPYKYAMPTSTSTMAANVRMPDYSTVLSSTVTSKGVVTTATSVEISKGGHRVASTNLSPAEVAGMSVAIAVVAAIVAALFSWRIWRRHHRPRTVFWDLPRGTDGELNKSNLATAPIDRDYLRSVQQERNNSTGTASIAPMLSLPSPQSESSEDRERRMALAPSDSSFVDSQRGSLYGGQATSVLSNANNNESTMSSSGTGGENAGDLGVGSNNPLHSPTTDFSVGGTPSYLASTSGSGIGVSSTSGRGSSSVISSGSQGVGSGQANPFVPSSGSTTSSAGHQRMAGSSARAYRGRSDDFDSPRNSNSRSDLFEVLPMIDTGRRASGSASGARRPTSASQMTPTLSHSSGSNRRMGPPSTGRSHTHSNSQPEIVQHQDAGLLMDDSIDDEEMLARVELPPSYHQINRPGRRDRTDSNFSGDSPTSSAQQTTFSSSSSLNTGLGARQGHELDPSNPMSVVREDEDESEFWRSPP